MADISWPALAFLAFIILQRLGELALAHANTARLLATGAREVGADHYPMIVALHTLWVLALVVFGWNAEISLAWLALFAALQVLRLWILSTLGRRWTTRIILTDTPLVARGPFRYVRHPNYCLVVVEIFVAPMVLGLVCVALVFSLANAGVLGVRIRAEERALAPMRLTGSVSGGR